MQCSKRTVLTLAAISFLAVYMRSVAQDGTITKPAVPEASHKGRFPAVLQAGFRSWDKGHLIAVVAGALAPNSPAVTVYDRDGRVTRETPIWMDGASEVMLTDAAMSQTGSLIVSGGARNADGAVTNFIAEIGADNRVQKVIRTTPFTPYYVCALDNGTVWSYGFDRDRNLKGVQNSLRLRNFSFEKGELQALLNTTALPGGRVSGDWLLPLGRYRGEISFGCNSKMVTLYNSRSGDLVEVDLKSNTMTMTKVLLLPASPPDFLITGFALTDSGAIFASFRDRTHHGSPQYGLFRLKRERASTAQWVAVPGTVGYLKDTPIQKLWGADGDELVYARQDDGELYWSKLGPR